MTKVYIPPSDDTDINFDTASDVEKGHIQPLEMVRQQRVEESPSSLHLSMFIILKQLLRLTAVVLIIGGGVKFFYQFTSSMKVESQNLIIKGPTEDSYIEIDKTPFFIGGIVNSFHGILEAIFGIILLSSTHKPTVQSTLSNIKRTVIFLAVYMLLYAVQFMMYAKGDGVTIGQWIESTRKSAGHYTLQRESSTNIYNFEYSGKDYDLIDYEEKDYFIQFMFNFIFDEFGFKGA